MSMGYPAAQGYTGNPASPTPPSGGGGVVDAFMGVADMALTGINRVAHVAGEIAPIYQAFTQREADQGALDAKVKMLNAELANRVQVARISAAAQASGQRMQTSFAAEPGGMGATPLGTSVTTGIPPYMWIGAAFVLVVLLAQGGK